MTDRLKEIAERVEKATPGPWEVDDSKCCVYSGDEIVVAERLGFDSARSGDADFIARAREDIPYLLATIERQAKVIAEARNLVGALASLAAVAHAAGLYEAYEAHGIAAQRLRAILEGES